MCVEQYAVWTTGLLAWDLQKAYIPTSGDTTGRLQCSFCVPMLATETPRVGYEGLADQPSPLVRS